MSSPLIKLGAVASLVLLFAAPSFSSVEVTEKDGRKEVIFRYRPDGGARSVHVAGSFNDWNKAANPLRDDDGDGVFEARLAISGSRHTYKYVVDGAHWLQDKENKDAEADGHGGFNSIINLGGAERPKTGGAAKAGEHSPFGSTVEREKENAFVGEIYFLEPNTQRLPKFHKSKRRGKIYTGSIDIAPQSFAKGFPGLTDRFEWFAIRYRGKFRAEKTGVYRFRLLADDGARLYINGKLAVDNDGLHGPRSKENLIKLKAGEHKIVLDYMQGPALEVALQLFVTKPGSTQEEILKPSSAAPRDGSATKVR